MCNTMGTTEDGLLECVPETLIPEKSRMVEGTIKKLTDKGFGFIIMDGEDDLFFHSKDVQGTSYGFLYEGQRVFFKKVEDGRRPRAENVRPVWFTRATAANGQFRLLDV